MHSNRLILALLLICMLPAACGPLARLRSLDCASPDVLCAGLVTDFGSVASGINHEAWLGLQDALAAHLVDRIDYIETVDARDRNANIEYLADRDYDIIVTVGYSMSDLTKAAAEKYKRLRFIGVEQPQPVKVRNLAGLVFHEERSGFLAGALAALLTETDHVAAVCDAKFVDAIRRYCDGFLAGAHYVDPKLNVIVTYRQGPADKLFNDPNWGRAAALLRIHEGADVLFAAGGNTATAALQVAAANGVYVIGSETDLYPSFEDLRPMLVTSAFNDVRLGVTALVRMARDKEFPQGEYEGVVGLAPWHDLERQVPSTVKQDLEKIKIKLALDSIHIDVPYTSQ